jgi:peptidoglycan/xylan/chitin deacetylase (PgdA/CDA1 family)
MNIFNIPIITYHKISSKKEFGLTTVNPSIFQNQMQILAENSFQSITFKQIEKNQEMPEKPIIITFDDTYKSVYENAFPTMKEFNFKGVLFVISEFIGKKNTWEAYSIQRKHYHANMHEISDMQEYGFEIGSHCRSHRFLPHLSREEVKNELEDSKQYLEKIFNTNIISGCYPYGGYNKEVIGIAKSVKYKYGTGNIQFLNGKNNLLCLHRRSIYSIDSVDTFKNKIKFNSKSKLNFISEWLIQKGAYAGIWKNKFL